MAAANSPCFGEDFQMVIEPRGEIAVVRLAGSVHMDTSERLQNELVGLVDRPTRVVIVDISGVSFICSLGLGALVAAHLRARRQEGSVRLVCPAPGIRSLLEITGLIKIFPPYDSIEAALPES